MAPDIKLLATITGHAGPVFALEAAGPDSFYSGSSDKHVAEWNLETFSQEKFTVVLSASVYAVCRIEKLQLLLIGLSNGSLHVIDLKERKEIRHLKQHRQGIFDIKYSEEKQVVYTCDAEGYFCAWNLPDFSLAITLPLTTEKIRKITVNEKLGHLALACGDNCIRILETEFYNEIFTVRSHTMAVNTVLYVGDVLWSGGKDALLKRFEAEKKYEELSSVPAHNYAIYGIASDPQNKLVATVSRDKTIKLWKSESGDFLIRINKILFDGHSHSVNSVLWHPEKKVFITGGDDRSIKVWKIE